MHEADKVERNWIMNNNHTRTLPPMYRPAAASRLEQNESRQEIVRNPWGSGVVPRWEVLKSRPRLGSFSFDLELLGDVIQVFFQSARKGTY